MKLDPAGIGYDGGTSQMVQANSNIPAEPSKGKGTNSFQAPQYGIAGIFQTIACPQTRLFRVSGCHMPLSWHGSRPCTCTSCKTMRQRTAYPSSLHITAGTSNTVNQCLIIACATVFA